MIAFGATRKGDKNDKSDKSDIYSISNVCYRISIPPTVKEGFEHIGIKNLYQWQGHCLFSTGVLEDMNLLYCAPTSGGKSFVSEIMCLKTVLRFPYPRRKKAIYIVPFVSLVLEKEKYFKKILSFYNKNNKPRDKIKAKGFHGELGAGGMLKVSEDIIVCTIEKANGILNSFISRGRVDRIGCIVIDEMHTLGHSFNGFLLEMLISKVRYLESKSKACYEEKLKNEAAVENNSNSHNQSSCYNSLIQIQLIGMSATVGNIELLGCLFGGSLYTTDFRPVPLVERLVVGTDICDSTGNAECSVDSIVTSLLPSHIDEKIFAKYKTLVSLCIDGLRNGQQVLIFCSTKALCQRMCSTLTALFQGYDCSIWDSGTTNTTGDKAIAVPVLTHKSNRMNSETLIESRDTAISKIKEESAAYSTTLCSGIASGFAYHHSGLSTKEKDVVEKSFRQGILSILCATTTLATGINLPAGRVIIESMEIGGQALDVSHYRQMSGRAGRAGQSTYGESYLLVKPNYLKEALELVNGKLPDVKSQIHPRTDGGRALMKAILEVHHLGLCSNITHFKEYIMHTLMYKECCTKEQKAAMMTEATSYLAFLISAGALDSTSVNAFPAFQNKRPEEKVPNSVVDSSSSIHVSRFGKAIVASGLNPDEAIIMYSAIKEALNGMNLEIPLHILYLIIPLEHNAYPDFSCIYNLVESLEKETAPSPLKSIVELLGLTGKLSTLHRWTLEKPDKRVFDNVFVLLRQFSLKRWRDIDGNSAQVYKVEGYKCNWKEEDLKLLGCCKRFWGAYIMFDIMKGLPIAVAMKKFNIEFADIEALQWQTQLIAAKVQKFCSEIGQSAIEKLIANVREHLNSSVPKELRDLVKIPRMNSKVAKLLHDNLGVSNAAELLKCKNEEPCALVCPCNHVIDSFVSSLHLSLGFELKILDDSEDTSTLEECNEENDDPVKGNAYDDDVKVKIRSWACAVLNEAKQLLDRELQVENEKVALLMAAVDYGNQGDDDAVMQDEGKAEQAKEKDGNDDNSDCTSESSHDLMDSNSFDDPLDVEPSTLQGEDSGDVDEDYFEEKSILPKGIEIHKQKGNSDVNEQKSRINLDIYESDAMFMKEARHVFCHTSQIDEEPAIGMKATTATTPIGRLHTSQYMTQFTQTKLPSPGKFLYRPQLQNADPYNQPSFAEDVIKGHGADQGFGWKLINNKFSCDEFLKKLKNCKAVAFELVYRRIPNAAIANRKSRSRWANIVAQACPVMASSNFDGVSNSTSLELDSSEVHTGMKDPHIITGIALNFGDEYSYYISLPTIPPLYDYNEDMDDAPDTESMICDINSIPLSCCVLISRFVGYQLILGRNPHLRAAVLEIDQTHNPNLKNGADRNGLSLSNSMMLVSKRWTAATRVGLYFDWCRKACAEWQLLGEVMKSDSITKIAVDIKSKLTCLRERDVLVRGHLEDPSIAKALLPREIEMSLKIPETSKFSLNSTVKVACYRAASVFRTMAAITLHLRNHQQLELFRTIEMPLLNSVSEIDYVGCPADNNFFRDLLQNLVDRQTIIKSYFDSIDKNFNPLSSRRDMQKLKDELIIRYVDAIDEMRKAQSNKSGMINRSFGHTDPTTAIRSHPLMRLAAEYRQSVAFASLCKSLIYNNVNGRIRFTSSTLHTETGRLSVTNPPLQQIPRNCSYKFTSRLNLHQELSQFSHKEKDAMIDIINNDIKSGESFWIRVRLCPLQSKIRLDKKFRVGKLLFISSVSILETPLEIHRDAGDQVHGIYAVTSVVDSWRARGFSYDNVEASKVLQCVVVFDDGDPLLFPSDQLEKLDAEVLPDDSEVNDINKALADGLWAADDNANTDGQHVEDKRIDIFPREGFTASEGYVLLSADYSQIELRVLAHFSGDPNLCRELCQGLDIFKKVAAKWKKKQQDEVTDEERDLVKSITYSFLFGAGSKLIAEEADISIEEVKMVRKYIDEDYENIKKVEQQIKKSCATIGFVQTLKGRRRYFPDIKSNDQKKRSKAERQCFNTVMQGTAADILKTAMININSTLEREFQSSNTTIVYRQPRSSPGGGIYKKFDDVRFILHVHDELLFEVREDLLKKTASIVRHCMQSAASLKVPIKVKLKAGKTWAHLTDYKLNE